MSGDDHWTKPFLVAYRVMVTMTGNNQWPMSFGEYKDRNDAAQVAGLAMRIEQNRLVELVPVMGCEHCGERLHKSGWHDLYPSTCPKCERRIG